MGKRKLRFDVRKNYERKKQRIDKTISSTSPSTLNPQPATMNECNVRNLHSVSHDKLPPGWTSTCVTSCTNRSRDSLALYKLQLQQPLASVNIAYMVTVSPDCTWTVCVGNKIINTSQCSRLNSLDETISNADDLIQLLVLVDGSKHCVGNPDEKFSDLVVSHKGIFKNQQGLYYTQLHSYIVNYMHGYS